MKTKNKKIDTGYYVQKADILISATITEIKTQNKMYAVDQARQFRPLVDDPMELFIPKIKGWFESLLEKTLKIIGGFEVLNQKPEQIKKLYEREVGKLNEKKEELLEDVRLIQKDLDGLIDISGVINQWKYKWRIILILLTFGECSINYKALLSVTPNQIVAIISAIALSICLFITAHSFKDFQSYFNSKNTKIVVGILDVLLVLLLLFGLNELRLSYMENDGMIISDTSKYSLIILNFALWLSGAVIAFVYKPLKSQIEKNNKFQKVKKELHVFTTQVKEIDKRMEAIPDELEQKQVELYSLQCMAKHYENIVCAEYYSCVADFKEHNLFSRKDKVTPKAFLEQAPKLRTYFDTIHASSQSL